jgi:hypothetical protein
MLPESRKVASLLLKGLAAGAWQKAIEGENLLQNPRRTFEAQPRYFQRLWRTTTIDEVVRYAEIVGSRYLVSMLQHSMDHAGIGLSGHPDLTIRDGHLTFREVKGQDRMHGNQAIWVRDFARPLGLDLAIIRVSQAKK